MQPGGLSEQEGLPCCPEQDDLLHETLTVWEVLYYAAMLRLPRSMPEEAKRQRVDDVITALGIQACKGTIIGARGAALCAIVKTCHPGCHSWALWMCCM